jgi:hypothetical protein
VWSPTLVESGESQLLKVTEVLRHRFSGCGADQSMPLKLVVSKSPRVERPELHDFARSGRAGNLRAQALGHSRVCGRHELRSCSRCKVVVASGAIRVGEWPLFDDGPPRSAAVVGSRGVLQGYNAQAAATADQIVLAAEVTAATNDQPHFVPLATAVTENLTEADHHDGVGAFVADAGYWTASNGTADVGAAVLIATRTTAWRKTDQPTDDKLAVLAKVNRGELSQRRAGDILGVSHTWVRDMTKRYFGKDGQRIARTADPEPDEWIPVIERLARGEISQRAARDELTVSPARIKVMLAHLRGEAVDPTIARRAMDHKLADPTNTELYRKRKHSIEPVFGNIKANLGYRRFGNPLKP